jgi:hypothetical protein
MQTAQHWVDLMVEHLVDDLVEQLVSTWEMWRADQKDYLSVDQLAEQMVAS